MSPPRRPLVLLLAVAAASVAGWAGSLRGGFVYDDHRFVEGNPHLDAVASAPWRAFDPATASADGAEPGMWRPLRTLSFALDRALFGADPSGARLASVLLHAAAAALVFAGGIALGIGDLGSALGAALFALHPAQAEGVAWISSRGDLLAGVLLLAAVVVHLRRAPAWAAAGLASLAFLAKESAVAAPLLLAAADLAAGGLPRLRERWRAAAAAAVALLLLVGVRAAVLASSGAELTQGAGMGLGPAEMAAAVPAMLGWYAFRALVPLPGTFDHQLGALAPWAMGALALGCLLASWGRLGLPGRAAGPARAAAAWALAALLPVTLLQLLFPLKILVADRFLYLGLAGPALALGALAEGRGERFARCALAAAPLLLLAALPAAGRWRSDEALWSDTRERDPGHARALYGLGAAREEADPAGAVSLYRDYLRQAPGDPGAWFRKGMAEERLALRADSLPPAERGAERRGRLLRAAEALGEAIRIWEGGEREGRARGLAEARLARACVLAALGEEGGAEAEARAAKELLLREKPARRSALAPRARVLARWARERGLEDLERGLLAAAGGGGGP